MKAVVREVQKLAEKLKSDGEIEAYTFGHDKRHHLIEFRVRGKWMSVPFSDTPRSSSTTNYARQQIRRRIRAMS